MKDIVAKKFTLVELLVVIVIITILAGMLLPALGKAKAYAKTTECISAMKQNHLIAASYANDNHDFWIMRGSSPTGHGYGSNAVPPIHLLAMTGYGANVRVTGCVAVKDYMLPKTAFCDAESPNGILSFAYSVWHENNLAPDLITSTSIAVLCEHQYTAQLLYGQKVKSPGIFPYFFDAVRILEKGWFYAYNLSGAGQYIHARHNNQVYAVCLDGHVQLNPMKAFSTSGYCFKNANVKIGQGAVIPMTAR